MIFSWCWIAGAVAIRLDKHQTLSWIVHHPLTEWVSTIMKCPSINCHADVYRQYPRITYLYCTLEYASLRASWTLNYRNTHMHARACTCVHTHTHTHTRAHTSTHARAHLLTHANHTLLSSQTIWNKNSSRVAQRQNITAITWKDLQGWVFVALMTYPIQII